TNVLALEVRPTALRLGPTIEVALAASDLGHIVRGPVVQRLGERSATIVFETDLPMLGEVHWGVSAGAYEHTAGDAEPAMRHEIALADLPAGATVHYDVAVRMAPDAGDDASPDYAFHTAPGAADVVRFVVYGDVRGGHEIHREVLRAALAEAPDFVVSTGDMVQRGSDEADWQ